MKIVFLDVKTLGDVPNLDLFREFGEFVCYQTTAPDQVAARISGAAIVITNKVMLDRAAMELARALDADLLAGAALDVFEQEPIRPDNPLLHIRNKHKLVLTPHIAWGSLEARTLLLEKVGHNIRSFIQSS